MKQATLALTAGCLLAACNTAETQQTQAVAQAAPVVEAPAPIVRAPVGPITDTTDLWNDWRYWAGLRGPSFNRVMADACGDGSPGRGFPLPPRSVGYDTVEQAKRSRDIAVAYNQKLDAFYDCAEENMTAVATEWAEGQVEWASWYPIIEQKQDAGLYDDADEYDREALADYLRHPQDLQVAVDEAVERFMEVTVADLEGERVHHNRGVNMWLEIVNDRQNRPSFGQMLNATLGGVSASMRNDVNRGLVASGQLPMLSPKQQARIRDAGQAIAAREAAQGSGSSVILTRNVSCTDPAYPDTRFGAPTMEDCLDLAARGARQQAGLEESQRRDAQLAAEFEQGMIEAERINAVNQAVRDELNERDERARRIILGLDPSPRGCTTNCSSLGQ
ncbi:hypothetical protein FHS89_000891 [Rubricella aquisinus]|uniref:Uncharacterized protein n=1 Tax=Rubricella aquisinus TaxID=2028108 RepID=A0A840WYY2_9RHOB|nr:hypothetical protein [Rubricella aquisinus]MBB5514885.1 hypothetical protein [Rubricella aquisinus]